MHEQERLEERLHEGAPDRGPTVVESGPSTPVPRPDTLRPGTRLTSQEVLSLQRAAGNAATSAAIARMRGGGAGPLPPATASQMERAFGRDFSGVRVHEDSPKATGSTRAVTEGTDVHFAPGRFRPGSSDGDWLIAHELAHVVQQSGSLAVSEGPAGETVGALEADATLAAGAATAARPATVLLGARRGAPQAYEAWEHSALGNAMGGENVTITTATGVQLTYGEIVALSGDFYRSPADLMNAPAGELRAILDRMRTEREQAARGPGGAPTDAEIAENNREYEKITAEWRVFGGRAERHSHSDPLGDDHDHEEGEGHGHEGHGHEGGEHGEEGHGHGEGDRGTEEDLSVPEQAPGATEPAADATFLSLADANASHFSPENIRNNFKPRHLGALQWAQKAWEARNGRPPPPLPTGEALTETAREHGETRREPGAAPSARMGTLPPEGATPTGANPSETSGAGPATGAHSAQVEGGPPGSAEEARAWLASGFSAHFLTDAFAGGHLVSGIVGRRRGVTFFQENSPAIRAKLVECIRAEHSKVPEMVLNQAVRAVDLIPDGKLGSIMLKLVHDKLNIAGVEVKNALGTRWQTLGDANLARSPDTTAQAQLATKAARDSIEEVLRTGTCAAPYRALDYIPDVARMPPGGFRPIADFAQDESVFDLVLRQTTIDGDDFYRLVKNYIPVLKGLARDYAGLAVDWVKRKVGGLVDRTRALLDRGRRLFGGLIDAGRERLNGLLESAREGIGGLVEAGRDKAREIGESLGDLYQRGREAVSGAIESGREAVGGLVESGREAARGVGGFFSGLYQRGREAVSGAIESGREAVGGLIQSGREAAQGIGERISSGGRAFVEGVKALAGRAKDKAIGAVSGALDTFEDVKHRLRGEPERLESSTQGTTEVNRQAYAHGGFMGAAGRFMQDAQWNAIFATLMPAEHAQATRLTNVDELMGFLENNPILAAYGSYRHMREVNQSNADARPDAQHKAMPLEWDVWLPPDPAQVTDLGAVRIAHGNKGTTVGQALSPDDPIGNARDDVRSAPSGDRWMELFGRAMALARSGAERGGQAPGNAEERRRALERLNQTTQADAAVQIATEFLGPEGGLILDVKSTYSKPEDIAAFVRMLRSKGINVIGVGTFRHSQLSALEQVDPGIRRVKFFHGLAGLENAARRNELTDGDDVMFNAGALLSTRREYVVAGETRYTVDRAAFQRVSAVQQAHKLNIGLYVQETAVSPEAVQVITELVNSETGVFSRGFAYGNVSGNVEAEVSGTGMGDQSIPDLGDRLAGARR